MPDSAAPVHAPVPAAPPAPAPSDPPTEAPAAPSPERRWKWLRVGLALMAPVLLWLTWPLTRALLAAAPRSWHFFGILPWPVLLLAAALGLLAVAGVLRLARLSLQRYLWRGFGAYAVGVLATFVASVLVLFSVGFDDCSYPSGARWTDPALAAAATGPGWSLQPAASGLALPAGTLPWPGANLTGLHDSASGSGDYGFHLDAHGRATFRGTWTAGAAVDFRAFTARLSSAGNATVAAWEAQMAKDPSAGVVLAPLDRLPALVREVVAHGTVGTDRYSITVGSATVYNGTWDLDAALPVHVRAGDYTLRVDAVGHASLEGLAHGDEPFAAYAERIVKRLAADGLPAPAAHDLRVEGAVC